MSDERFYQDRVHDWMLVCFSPAISFDREERNHRFIEEALELVQACGATASECHQLVDYVFDRPVGETELARIWTKLVEIRAMHAAKPKHLPLPGGAVPAIDQNTRALAALNAAPDVDPAKATRAEVKAMWEANAAAWAILNEGRDPPSRRGDSVEPGGAA